MEHHEIAQYLSKNSAFAGISKSQQDALADIAVASQTKESGFLVLEKEKSIHLFLIVEGSASVEIALPGSSAMESVAKLKAGDIFGEFGLLGVDRRSASVRALSDVTCLQIPHEAILDLCQKDCELGYRLMTNLARTLADRLITTTRDFGNAMYQMVFTGKND
ncbi:MAG: cyclic nucleotide-binding domain-containing protein [Oligoflexales bacterium]